MMLPVRAKETASMLTRDGVRLDADIYCPDAAGMYPVLLMRQPYGRAIASTVVYAHPIWYAAHGYIVVIQDVRGRGSSEGEFRLFASEIEDGYDSVNWAAALPGSNGNVGMYGFSYQGMTQLYAAAAQPEALKTICPSMVGYDLYRDWAYEGGAFCYQLNLGWAMQLAAETARRQGDRHAYITLYNAARQGAIADPVCPKSPLLEQLAPDSFYHDWLAHPTADAYWDNLSPRQSLQSVDLPMLHLGGWFDTYLRGTLRLYREMAQRSQFAQYLVVGPWAHLPWGRKVGAVDYGAIAASPIDRLQIRWFDQFLKGSDTGLLNECPVSLFEMGSNRWRNFQKFPAATPTSYWMKTTGLAGMGDGEGWLVPQPPAADSTCPDDVIVHDPWRPVPALGGHATLSAGSFDRSSLDCRTDVLTYTSEPLEADLYLAGEVTVSLCCTADTASFDLCVVLSEVKPDGQVFNIAQGYRRLAQPSEWPIDVTLQPTCVCLRAGHALRLSVSGACFPAYVMNGGTGALPAESSLLEARVITLVMREGSDDAIAGKRHLSHVRLPVVAESE